MTNTMTRERDKIPVSCIQYNIGERVGTRIFFLVEKKINKNLELYIITRIRSNVNKNSRIIKIRKVTVNSLNYMSYLYT